MMEEMEKIHKEKAKEEEERQNRIQIEETSSDEEEDVPVKITKKEAEPVAFKKQSSVEE